MGTIVGFPNFAAQRMEFVNRGSFGRSVPFGGPAAIARQRLPTAPVGSFSLTLTNLVVGSVIQIEDQVGGTTRYNGTAASTSAVVSLSAYVSGSALNDLRIKVRKGSGAPYFKPYETLTTAFVGSQSIYVSQIQDD
ncbi:MAG: hypothetical protein KA784_00110 [Aquabacterium sp.]|nr:hypothetical protein [Aquabacterium sp.]